MEKNLSKLIEVLVQLPKALHETYRLFHFTLSVWNLLSANQPACSVVSTKRDTNSLPPWGGQ